MQNDRQSKQIEELKADRDKWLGKYYNADELLTLAKEEIKELQAEIKDIQHERGMD